MSADDGLRAIVHSRLGKAKGWHWTPIETGSTTAGVPDSHWAHEPTQLSGWVEHKATKGWAVTVRPHQVSWMLLHLRCGVHCTIMVRAKGKASSKGIGDSLWAIDGNYVKILAEHSLAELPEEALLGRWYGSPDMWNWYAVGAVLTGPRLRP